MRHSFPTRRSSDLDININIDSEGRVFSFGDSFYRGRKPRPPVNDPNLSDADFPANEDDADDIQGAEDFVNMIGQMVFMDKKKGKSRFSTASRADDESNILRLGPKDALLAFSHHINQEIVRPDGIELAFRTSFASENPRSVLTNVPYTVSGEVPTSLVYIQNQEGSLELVHDLELEMDQNWYHAHVSAVTGKIVSLVDWTSDSGYSVFPLGYNDPRDGPRIHVKDPQDENASPLGWHSQGQGKNFTVTIGNNVYAHENIAGASSWENNHRPDGGKSLIFNSTLNLDSNPKDYIDAAVTNLFYWNNIIHDVFHRYGFDEKAGNFQENNFGRGGKGGDAVIANAQDGSGFNNANFATPPDGQRGKMRMYVWNTAEPFRDGDLESGIVVHEYAHGISTRLTGGPANSGCLGWGEAGGMGEGWGDFFATVLRMSPSTTRDKNFMMGDYCNNGEGIRRYAYSVDKDTNPETYAVMDKPGYWGVHAKGEVWAEMLFEVYWNLVEKHGFTSDWYSASPEHGNTLAIQLVIDGMKLQPCRPTFIQARDAILQADQVLTGGKNVCEIWKGFAKRGLGVGAKVDGGTPWGGGVRKDSFKVSKQCRRS